jgi:BlaI family transcriptional regulator, penicillinase repressor
MARPPVAALTAVQFEIMQVVWNAPGGATVAEIWEAVSRGREVTRTTVLNLVARLDDRGWLKRRKTQGIYRYFSTVDRETASSNAAEKFVDDFFGGSATELVMSLLGTKRITKAQLEELRKLVEQANSRPRKSQERSQ